METEKMEHRIVSAEVATKLKRRWAPFSPLSLEHMPEGPWFHFRQNNSGGFFIGPKNVIILAADEKAAWERLRGMEDYSAEACSCCGARWYGEESTKAEIIERLTELSNPEAFDRTFDPEVLPCLIML